MKDLIEAIFGVILFTVVIIAIIMGIANYCDHRQYKKDVVTWNNGYCQCGGEWEYQQAVGHQVSTEYIYKCNKCNTLFETMTYFKSNP